MTFRPLLAAAPEKIEDLKYPVLASPKIDGIRCLTRMEDLAIGPYSRKLKPIPNAHIFSEVSKALPPGLDGELVTFSDATKNTEQKPIDDFNTIQSKVMSRDGSPDFAYMVFDYFEIADLPFATRYQYAAHAVKSAPPWCKLVDHKLIHTEAQLLAYEQVCLMQGFEGVMVRAPDGPYKYGRSTAKEGILLKIKRFDDMEAVVVGYTELMRNANEAEQDALGHTKRSHSKDGLVPAGVLGALQVADRRVVEHFEDWNPEGYSEDVFEVGSGFDALQREMLWTQRDTLKGRLITVKHQGFGSQGKPRFPIFKGFRHEDDT